MNETIPKLQFQQKQHKNSLVWAGYICLLSILSFSISLNYQYYQQNKLLEQKKNGYRDLFDDLMKDYIELQIQILDLDKRHKDFDLLT